MNLVLALLLAVSCLYTADSAVKYTGHRLVSFLPQDVQQAQLLQTYLRLVTSSKNPLKLDLWSYRVTVGKEFLLRVPPESFGRFRLSAATSGLQFRINLHDIQGEIDRQAARRAQHQVDTMMPLDLERYHGYADIMSFVDGLASECGSRCTVSTIGTSTEGRAIRMIKITGTPNSAATAVFVDGTIHAREWISPNTVLWIIRSFVRDYATRSEVRAAVDRFDWYFVPMVNPDGYEYTRDELDGDRMWRKTRSDNPSEPDCPGTDGNRNFDFQWGGIGSSGDPCSDTYRGADPFSEPETRALRDAMRSVEKPITCYTAVHSHGEYWLSRWGYTFDLPPNSAEMDRVGDAVADRILEAGGQSFYTVGPSAITLYPASGGAGDYFYGVGGATYSYVVELPGRGYGFLLPEEEIRDVAEETLEGYIRMAEELQVSQ